MNCLELFSQELKSENHGLEMMVSREKKEIINDIRFEGGLKDETIDVLRIDHIGHRGDGPLIVSSKYAIPTDSLMLKFELITMVLPDDVLSIFLRIVDNVTFKTQSTDVDYVLLKFTYRYKGRIEQFFITNPELTVIELKEFEKFLKENCEQATLDSFYKFLSWTDLFYYSDDRKSVIWKDFGKE